MPALRAKMGYVGSVTFGNVAIPGVSIPGGKVTVRATSCDVKASQDITYPEVIDGRMDRTLYQLGPRVAQGNISFPLIHEGAAVFAGGTVTCGQTVPFGQLFWRLASERDQYGRLMNDSMDLRVRYTDNTAYRFPNCIVNQMTISVTQSEPVNFSADVIAGSNSSSDVRIDDNTIGSANDLQYLSPARIVTWNDFVMQVYGDAGSSLVIRGEEIRSFEVTLNNNAERYYTLNGKLAPQDVVARKRTIEGNFKLMGRNTGLSTLAYTNQDRFTSTAGIAFGYKLGGETAAPYWATGLHGVVFQMEEIALTNDLVETTVNYSALGDCEANYEATQKGGTYPITNPPSGTNYGGPTSPLFPGFV